METNICPSLPLILPPNLTKILDGEKFFRVLSCDGARVLAQCVVCDAHIKGSVGQSSNYLAHLKAMKDEAHQKVHQEYVQMPTKKRTYRSPRFRNANLSAHPPKRPLISPSFETPETPPPHYSEETDLINNIITNYILDGVRPFSTVQSEEFKSLVNGLRGKPLNTPILSSFTLASIVQQRVNDLIVKIQDAVSRQEHLCLTVDAWTGGGQNYVGIAVHYIAFAANLQTFCRHSYVIALKRFPGPLTPAAVKDTLFEVMDLYGVDPGKVVGIVTDGGSNFVKAFKEFTALFAYYGVPTIESDSMADDEMTPEISDLDELEVDLSEPGLRFSEDDTSIKNEVLPDSEGEQTLRQLPSQFRCTPLTLHRIAATDLGKLITTSKTFSVIALRKAFLQAGKYWKACTWPKSREVIEGICGKPFLQPVDKRWNSWFRAIERFVELIDTIPMLREELPDLPPITELESEILKDYLTIMEPVANLIDDLQGNSVFLGDFLPSLFCVKSMLDEMDSQLKYLHLLRNEVINALEVRFEKELNLEDEALIYIAAAASHPLHKLHWVTDDGGKRKSCEEMLLTCMREESAEAALELEAVDQKPPPILMNRKLRFSYASTSSSVSAFESNHAAQLRMYLNDKTDDLNMLEKYPAVKAVFFRYNTLMPSQGPSERLCSFGRLVLAPSRQRLSDEVLEALALLKCNKNSPVDGSV